MRRGGRSQWRASDVHAKPKGVRTASGASSTDGDRHGAFNGRIRQWANDFYAQFVGLYCNCA